MYVKDAAVVPPSTSVVYLELNKLVERLENERTFGPVVDLDHVEPSRANPFVSVLVDLNMVLLGTVWLSLRGKHKDLVLNRILWVLEDLSG
jgi:hypothetical protein